MLPRPASCPRICAREPVARGARKHNRDFAAHRCGANRDREDGGTVEHQHACTSCGRPSDDMLCEPCREELWDENRPALVRPYVGAVSGAEADANAGDPDHARGPAEDAAALGQHWVRDPSPYVEGEPARPGRHATRGDSAGSDWPGILPSGSGETQRASLPGGVGVVESYLRQHRAVIGVAAVVVLVVGLALTTTTNLRGATPAAATDTGGLSNISPSGVLVPATSSLDESSTVGIGPSHGPGAADSTPPGVTPTPGPPDGSQLTAPAATPTPGGTSTWRWPSTWGWPSQGRSPWPRGGPGGPGGP